MSETNANPQLGRYGRARYQYLEENQPVTFEVKSIKGTLFSHCQEIDEQANDLYDKLMSTMPKAEGITEELKREDPMKWVRLMNNCRHRIDEIIREELIYQP